jgi:hypothetical protein
MIRLKPLLTEMPIHKTVYSQIGETDRIIMSAEPTITPRNVDQSKLAKWKPQGLWYAIGTEWIDWTRDNMPEWEDRLCAPGACRCIQDPAFRT